MISHRDARTLPAPVGQPSVEGAAALATPAPATTGWILPALIGLAVGIVGVLAWSLRSASTALVPGQEAPAFELTTFDGQSLALTDLRGQVVVINFWASWCLECRVEAAALERTWRDYRARGVTFVGIDWLDTEKEALEYIRRYGVTYPNGPDLRGRIGRTYYLTGVPETIIIDRQGRIVPIESQSDGAPPLPKIVGPLTQGGLLDEAGLRRVLDGLLSDS